MSAWKQQAPARTQEREREQEQGAEDDNDAVTGIYSPNANEKGEDLDGIMGVDGAGSLDRESCVRSSNLDEIRDFVDSPVAPGGSSESGDVENSTSRSSEQQERRHGDSLSQDPSSSGGAESPNGSSSSKKKSKSSSSGSGKHRRIKTGSTLEKQLNVYSRLVGKLRSNTSASSGSGSGKGSGSTSRSSRSGSSNSGSGSSSSSNTWAGDKELPDPTKRLTVFAAMRDKLYSISAGESVEVSFSNILSKIRRIYTKIRNYFVFNF